MTARVAAVALVLLALGAVEAQAHGTSLSPASRVYVCRYLDRESEPCANAWRANPQAIYDWMAVLIARTDGRHRRLVPDGELCSGGDPKYAAFDRPSTRWLATALEPGRQRLSWVLNAPHATLSYRFYLTRDGFDPARPLRWDDLELIHDSGRRPAAKLDRFDVEVPQRAGRHILYTVWQRSDSPEAFYSCSDVVFGAQGDLPRTPPLPDESRNLPGGAHAGHGGGKAGGKRLKLSSRGIRLKRAIETDWGDGYCARVTVTNRSRRTRAWKATMRMPDQIESIWNVVSDQAGRRLRLRGETFNRVLRPGASTGFGFCASRRR